MKRWVEHFSEILNQPPPSIKANMQPAEVPLSVDCKRPSKKEIRNAIMHCKNNKAPGPDNIPAKAPGPDNIPAEALKADVEASTQILCDLFGKIWEEEDVPGEWKGGHLVKIPKKGNLSLCGNYRGIMLLSVPGKVLNGVILQRLKAAVDAELRDNQAGFRPNR